METPRAIEQVVEFHTTFKHPIAKEPSIPPAERCKLRVDLIAEELDELRAAIQDKNIVEVADALCDIQYVLAGAILEFGLGEKFKTLFDEVHRSNMSKACKTEAEAHSTVSHYKDKENTEAYFINSEGHFLVYRKTDNKTLKSVNYSKARLAEIVTS